MPGHGFEFRALATDYDGTLTDQEHVDYRTITALQRVRASGRALILVTGRRVTDLKRSVPEHTLFDLIVAENGAVLYTPDQDKTTALAKPPPELFFETLRQRGVQELKAGSVIVSSVQRYAAIVRQTIADLNLDLQLISNRDSLMVLPTGTDKATGLTAALRVLRITPNQVAGIGDAEDDLALLALCACKAAVQNALPLLKAHAQIVTRANAGEGVTELIGMLTADDNGA